MSVVVVAACVMPVGVIHNSYGVFPEQLMFNAWYRQVLSSQRLHNMLHNSFTVSQAEEVEETIFDVPTVADFLCSSGSVVRQAMVVADACGCCFSSVDGGDADSLCSSNGGSQASLTASSSDSLLSTGTNGSIGCSLASAEHYVAASTVGHKFCKPSMVHPELSYALVCGTDGGSGTFGKPMAAQPAVLAQHRSARPSTVSVSVSATDKCVVGNPPAVSPGGSSGGSSAGAQSLCSKASGRVRCRRRRQQRRSTLGLLSAHPHVPDWDVAAPYVFELPAWAEGRSGTSGTFALDGQRHEAALVALPSRSAGDMGISVVAGLLCTSAMNSVSRIATAALQVASAVKGMCRMVLGFCRRRTATTAAVKPIGRTASAAAVPAATSASIFKIK